MIGLTRRQIRVILAVVQDWINLHPDESAICGEALVDNVALVEAIYDTLRDDQTALVQ